MKNLLLFCSLIMLNMNIFSQKTITFPSKDGLPITADWYEGKQDDTFILLFHQATYSRGEYRETAPKFVKLGFNCLAIDLRSGGECNFVKNETYYIALEKRLSTLYLNSVQDIQASIDFAYQLSRKRVIVFGSSYSASLCLMEAVKNVKVKAVVAFSPGEYFGEDGIVRDELLGLNIPTFVATSQGEFPYMKALLSKTFLNQITQFKPAKDKGVHGSRALWENNSSNEEYWLSLMLFLSKHR